MLRVDRGTRPRKATRREAAARRSKRGILTLECADQFLKDLVKMQTPFLSRDGAQASHILHELPCDMDTAGPVAKSGDVGKSEAHGPELLGQDPLWTQRTQMWLMNSQLMESRY